MKAIRQFVSFLLGVSVGACLYTLLKLRPFSPARIANGLSEVGANHLGKLLRPPWVQRSLPPQIIASVPVHPAKHIREISRQVGEMRPPARPKPVASKVGSHASTEEVAAMNVAPTPPPPPMAQAPHLLPTPPVPQAPPAPTIFKTIGYVEKADGQLEAIILQENQVQVVHIGEYIAGRYLVTKITPDLVDAVDEAPVQSPMAKPDLPNSAKLAKNVAEQPSAPPSAAPVQPEVLRAEGAHPPQIQAEKSVAYSLGYVQQSDGKVETVVADGDSVRLIPETQTSPTMAQVIPPANLQGVASPTEGSPAPIVPVSSTTGAISENSMHSGRLPEDSIIPVEMKPLGFVVKADGEFAAILSQDDEICIVRQGDRFAGRYRALSVSAEAVEAEEEPHRQVVPLPFDAPPTFPDILFASMQQGPSLFSSDDCSSCKSSESGKASANVPDGPPRGAGIQPVSGRSQVAKPMRNHGQDSRESGQVDHATFIFQTLGYVQTEDGELQAIVADGPQVYFVKQGEMFADQYLATSVDPILVLAVKAPPGQEGRDFLSTQTESRDNPASKKLYGSIQFPHSDGAGVRPGDSHGQDSFGLSRRERGQTFHKVDASSSPVFADLGLDLLNSASTGFVLQSHFLMADNPKVGF